VEENSPDQALHWTRCRVHSMEELTAVVLGPDQSRWNPRHRALVHDLLSQENHFFYHLELNTEMRKFKVRHITNHPILSEKQLN
jgi:hypothetical protein